MKAIVTEFEKKEREGALPYYVARCTATQGDPNANVFNEDGSLNVMALQSRTFNLTKCFFPATQQQCEALEKGIKPNETSVNIALYQVDAGHKFNIVSASTGEIISDIATVTKTAEKQMVINGKVIKQGEEYTEETLVPKVYTQISLVLFCDNDENCVEGKVEDIAKRNFNTGVQNGTYIIVD